MRKIIPILLLLMMALSASAEFRIGGHAKKAYINGYKSKIYAGHRLMWQSDTSTPVIVQQRGREAFISYRTELTGADVSAGYWNRILGSEFKFNVTTISNVTADQFDMAISNAAAGLTNAGDALVIVHIGHGGHAPDLSGDETDGLDEIFGMEGGTYSDDRFRVVLDSLPAWIKITVVMDTCFSGTSTRSTRRDTPSEENMREVLLSGSADYEYGWFSNVGGGVFTSKALTEILAHGTNITANQFIGYVLENGPFSINGTNQTPQIEGSASNRNAHLFY